MPDVVTCRRSGAIEHLKIDDGKVNVLTLEVVEALRTHVERAIDDRDTGCMILEGNERALTVGLDTRTVLSNTADATRLLQSAGRLLNALYLSRLRTVVVTQGHATAAGAMLLLVADVRIGCAPGGKIGLSEVSVGLDVPLPTQQLIRDRIAVPHQYGSTALARLHDFEQARAVGFLDELVASREQAVELAWQTAERLSSLDERAYLETKLGMRSAYRALVERR